MHPSAAPEPGGQAINDSVDTGADSADANSAEDRAGEPMARLVSDWYAHNARDLPWRLPGTSAWAVLVSEVMLQQTPVARVTPVWTQWMQRWLHPGDLAAQSSADVIRAWGKLGYPRRALRLHQCARALVADFGGAVPEDVNALLSLPGVGAYTARAVATFAFGRRHPVVDTNVRRVVARSTLGQAEPGPPSTRRDQATVQTLLPQGEAAAARTSIALMELGALVCTAARPACPRCPLRERCAWRLAGCPEYTGPRRRGQNFTGTDRQVRGRLLDVLRDTEVPVERSTLELVWPEPVQRDRALASLLGDGLVVALHDDRYALGGSLLTRSSGHTRP